MNNPGKAKYFWLLLLLIFAISATAPRLLPADNLNSSKLHHVVAFKFHEDVSSERIQRAIQDFEDLEETIPEIRKFEGGKNVSGLGLSQEFTHCFMLTFDNEEDRDIYLPHSAHQEVVENNKPLIDKLLVMDFWGD